jgi:F-type H+-transporting ATPase subunit delta
LLRDPAAKRYAQAAFELARDKGELEVWERDLGLLREALLAPGAIAFLASRHIPQDRKLEVLQRVIGQPAALVWNLLRLLAEKNRLGLLSQIIETFQQLVDEERGIAHARVVTAVPMSGEERNAIARRLSELTGKQVQIVTREDPEILGGLIARIGDRLVDGSTKTKLIALKRQLAGQTR